MVEHMDLVFDMPLGMLVVAPENNRDVDTVEQLPVWVMNREIGPRLQLTAMNMAVE